MVYSLKKLSPGIGGTSMIVSSSLQPYPFIIQKPSERNYLSRLVPPKYEFHMTGRCDLEETLHLLVSKIYRLTGSAQNKKRSCLAAVCYQLAHVYYETEHGLGMASMSLNKVLELVEGLEIDPDNVITVLKTLNMMAFIEANHNSNTEKALMFLDKADQVYQSYRNVEPRLPEPTPVDVLLKDCPNGNRTWVERKFIKFPIVNARLYTLFYYIECYRILKVTEKEILYSHAALKLQMDNDIYLQCPLDWVQTCTQMSEWFLNMNAFQQAKHHMEAASMFLKDAIPKHFMYYVDTQEFNQYSADVSYSWSRYGMRLLKKSKTRALKKKTHKIPPSIFNNLLFDQFEEVHGGHDTPVYVDSFEDAEILANNIVKWIDETKEYYTFEMSNHFNGYLSIDKCHTYKNLAFFQDDTNEMEKLLKTGIVDMELLVDKLNDMSLRRQIWYELGNIYRFMMDIKYDHHVLNKKKVSESGSKIINEYSKTSISYYLKFINSFELFPECVQQEQKKPFLLAHVNLANCYNKQIIYDKDAKIKNVLECEKYYKNIINYCESHSDLEELISFELSCCRQMLEVVPSRFEYLSNLPKLSDHHL